MYIGIRDQQKITLLQRARAFASESISAKELEEARLGKSTHVLIATQHTLDQFLSLHDEPQLKRLECYAEVLYPPRCEKREHQLPGPPGTDDLRKDQYYWLRDDNRTDEDVLAHLRVLISTDRSSSIACVPVSLLTASLRDFLDQYNGSS